MACALVAALSLGGCMTRDPIVTMAGATRAGNWSIERQVDRVTAVPISSARLTTRASHAFEAFPQPVELQLTCFKDQPIVRLAFSQRVGSTRNSTLGYRFDEKPGHEIEARFLQDSRTVVIEDRDEVAQFLRELASSEVLYVRIRSLNTGRTAAEFKLAGAPAAIEAAFAACPIAPERTRPRRELSASRPST